MNEQTAIIVRCDGRGAGLRATAASVRGQTLPAQLVAVATTAAAAAQAQPYAERVLRVRSTPATRGQVLNAAARAVEAPLQASVACGAVLPRADWLERLARHFERPEVVGVSGMLQRHDGTPLLEACELRRRTWSADWGFSNLASAWRRETWARHRFNEQMLAGEDGEWAWRILDYGGVLVIDPFVAVELPRRPRTHAWSILRRSASEWQGLVTAGAPVDAVTARSAVRSWWIDVDTASPTPAQLQRLNYFRVARIAGRWLGARQARSRWPADGRGRSP